MSYAVKEIFYTLQGEGAHAGRPAVFCRFAGCNLWTGRERAPGDARSASSATPTSSAPTGRAAAVSPPRTDLAEAVARRMARAGTTTAAEPYVVCTGGEPLLQLDADRCRGTSQRRGFEVAVETNGTRPAPPGHRLDLREPEGGRRTRPDRLATS